MPHEIPAEPLDPNATKPGVRKLIQHRQLLAERGAFLTLIHVAIINERAAHCRATAAPLCQRSRLDLMEKAAARAEHGCLRTAARLLTGDAVLPSSPGTADKVQAAWIQALYRSEKSSALPLRRRGAVDSVSPKQVVRRIHKAHGSALLGPAGERNSHIHALLSSPRAGRTLARWVNSWLHAEPSAAYRSPWMCCGLTPLDKG